MLEAEDICARLADIGRSLITGLNDALSSHAVGECVIAAPYRWVAMPHLHASTLDPPAQRARSHLIEAVRPNGALLLDGHNSFVCAAHTQDDVRRTCDAFEAAAKTLSPGRRKS